MKLLNTLQKSTAIHTDTKCGFTAKKLSQSENFMDD